MEEWKERDVPYSIEFDDGKRLLRATLSGFWDAPTMQRFAHDIASARDAILKRYSRYDTLFHASGLTVQTPEIAEGFRRMQDAGRGINPGRVAVVLESALARLQAKRAVVDSRVAVFESEDSALAWLAGQPA
jgi:hypothetical protein